PEREDPHCPTEVLDRGQHHPTETGQQLTDEVHRRNCTPPTIATVICWVVPREGSSYGQGPAVEWGRGAASSPKCLVRLPSPKKPTMGPASIIRPPPPVQPGTIPPGGSGYVRSAG